MIKIIADTHTHTLACHHAYSTIAENAAAAKERGLCAIAMTEHSPSMPGAPAYIHFTNLDAIPRVIDGVTIIKGIEVNIMDYDGTLDLKEKWLKRLDWVIASMHITNLAPKSVDEHTRAWLAIANNPLVDVMGHMGDGRFAFDHEPVLKAVKENDKIIEINSHSFNPSSSRIDSDVNCAKIAKRCAELGIPVVASSDAHHASRIGDFGKSLELLEAVGYPEKLILNADKARFFAALEARKAYKA